jgi:pimeloyl-ACP methyl ester carboxylesterase
MPVLLVHGFPFNSSMWEPQLSALGDRHRMVAPDLKGFGRSDAPEDLPAYSVESYAAELKGLLDAIDVKEVVLAGLSMGGYIAFSFIKRYADVVAALVLADTRPDADAPEVFERRTAQQRQVQERGTEELVDSLGDALLGEHTRANKPDVVAATKRAMLNPPAGFVGALDAMKRRPDSTDHLTAITVPTLIVVGEADALAPADVARGMHAAIGGSQLAVIPDAGHLPNLERPEAFNRTLSDFLLSLQ